MIPSIKYHCIDKPSAAIEGLSVRMHRSDMNNPNDLGLIGGSERLAEAVHLDTIAFSLLLRLNSSRLFYTVRALGEF
jgi:hypothetical protein